VKTESDKDSKPLMPHFESFMFGLRQGFDPDLLQRQTFEISWKHCYSANKELFEKILSWWGLKKT
jgi:hypothetical protein